MQEDQASLYQSECGVFVVLPKQGVPDSPPSPTLVDTEEVQPERAEGPTSPPCAISSSPVPPSLASRSCELDDFYADVERAYRAHGQTPPTSDQQKYWKPWGNAILEKHKAALEILEAQMVIEEVENEVAQYLTRDTIARLRQRHYVLSGGDTSDSGMEYLSAISAVTLTV